MKSFKQFFEKNERWIIPSMLLFGVAADFVTFRTLKISTAFTLLIFHLILAGSTIAFINVYDAERRTHRTLRYVRLAAPLVIQFTFGALLSASFIFYWFSGAFSVSWPFILIIALLMASNDVFRHYYLKPIVQISVYFFVLFSLSSLILPYIFNTISVWAFVASGVLALFLIYLYVEILSRSLDHIGWQRQRFALSIFIIYLFMNSMYFLNIIPPIPLSLREGGVYHNIERTDGEYILTTEVQSVLKKILPGTEIRINEDSPVYVYTSVFAPVDLNTTIVHHWQFYDRSNRRWVDRGEFSFSIVGGREGGYRGFSVKSNTEPGLWRVSVETERGQVIGRVKFMIKYVDKEPRLIEVK